MSDRGAIQFEKYWRQVISDEILLQASTEPDGASASDYQYGYGRGMARAARIALGDAQTAHGIK